MATRRKCLDDSCEMFHCRGCGAQKPFNGADSVIFNYCQGCQEDWAAPSLRRHRTDCDGSNHDRSCPQGGA